MGLINLAKLTKNNQEEERTSITEVLSKQPGEKTSNTTQMQDSQNSQSEVNHSDSGNKNSINKITQMSSEKDSKSPIQNDISEELEEKLKNLESEPNLSEEEQTPISKAQMQNSQNVSDLVVEEQSGKEPEVNNTDNSSQIDSQADKRKFEESVKNLQKTSLDLEKIFLNAIKNNASDIHIHVGHRPIIRVNGRLQELNAKFVSPTDAEEFAKKILIQNNRKENLKDIKQLDLSYSYAHRRFRINLFKQMGKFSIVARVIPSKIRSVDELNLPPILKEFGDLSGGLVLITGPTGSGKSTTIASIINHINSTKNKNIITLEDPIEFVFPKKNSVIIQREFKQDFEKWDDALRSILRQDPNVVLVGEMRDLETIESAIRVAETGHLVFATLHTNSASQSIDRIIDVFPEQKQSQIKSQLARIIMSIVSQRLVPLNNGEQIAVMEIMVATPAIRSLIREGKIHQIDNLIQTGQDFGMVSMEKSLVELINAGKISADTARAVSTKPEQIDLLLSKNKKTLS